VQFELGIYLSIFHRMESYFCGAFMIVDGYMSLV